MRRLTAVAIALFALGIVLLAYSAFSGEATVYLFLIIPVFQSSSPWALGGMALVFVAIFLFFFSISTPVAYEPEGASAKTPQGMAPQQASKKFGGVVLLGPIPIVFGSDKRIAKWMLLVALVLIVLLVVVFWLFGTQLIR